MTKKLLIIIIVICLIFAVKLAMTNEKAYSQHTQEVAELLKLINTGGMFSESFKATIYAKAHEDKNKTYNFKLNIYSKGRDKTILVFLEPKSEKGKIILHIGDSYWQYFPRTKSIIILSASSHVAGNMSNVDIIRPPILDKYNYNIIDSIDGIEQENDVKYIVEFTPKSKRVYYSKIITEYTNFKETYSEIYSRTGILLKKIWYSNHVKNNDNVYIPVEAKIVNVIDENQYSTFRSEDLESLDIPDKLFNPDNMENIVNFLNKKS